MKKLRNKLLMAMVVAVSCIGLLAGCGASGVSSGAANVVNLRDKEKKVKNIKKTLDNSIKIFSLPVNITFTGRCFHESYKNFINYSKTD